jgi:hypothetical protein
MIGLDNRLWLVTVIGLLVIQRQYYTFYQVSSAARGGAVD